MKKIMGVLIMALIAVGLFMTPVSAEKFIGQDLEVVSVQPPQYIGYRLYVGTTGTTSLYYKVSAVVTGIGETRASAVLTVADANAVLSSTNTLQLIWARVSDATSYNVYKSTSSSSTYFFLLGNVAQGTYVLNDLGQTVGGAFSAPTVVGGNIEAEGDVTVGGDLVVVGGFTLTGNISVADITASGDLVVAGAGNVVGALTVGDPATLSTMAANGTAQFHGAVTAGALTSEAGITGVDFTVGGFFQFYSRTQAEIEAITSSAVGQAYFCNDCTVTAICVSSVTPSATSWCSPADIGVACD